MKSKEFKSMNKQEMEKKIKELKLELIKAEVSTSKAGNSKIKKIKREIAKIITLGKKSKDENELEKVHLVNRKKPVQEKK